jgi:glutaredoxin
MKKTMTEDIAASKKLIPECGVIKVSVRTAKMPPVKQNGAAYLIEKYFQENRVVIFSKSFCPFSNRIKELFKSLNQEFLAIELDKRADGDNIKKKLRSRTLKKKLLSRAGLARIPSVFVNGNHVGGCRAIMSAHRSGKLEALLSFRASSDQQVIEICGTTGVILNHKCDIKLESESLIKCQKTGQTPFTYRCNTYCHPELRWESLHRYMSFGY